LILAERFPTTIVKPGDTLLYAALLRHGAANAHVTDYVKSRGRASDEWPDDLEADAELFEQEVAIVQPTLLVALGDRTFVRSGAGYGTVAGCQSCADHLAAKFQGRLWHWLSGRRPGKCHSNLPVEFAL
jgi:hypothetical protein